MDKDFPKEAFALGMLFTAIGVYTLWGIGALVLDVGFWFLVYGFLNLQG